MVITYDLYRELELDRSWDESTIKKQLKEIQRLWTKRQSACNDKEQLMLIDRILKYVEDGYRYLVKQSKREEYDKALDKAYKDGKLKYVDEEKMKTLLEQARQYYQKGNVKLAAQTAQEAINGNINDPEAYNLLARCYYDMQEYDKAVATIDTGTEIYKDNLNLYWLGARIATVGTQDYDDAQKRINKLIELAPDNSIGQSELINLHMRKGEEDLAYSEIDKYISDHPEDNQFKKNVAYDIISYSYSFYYYNPEKNETFIADKEAYEKCVELRTKANGIFNDEYTQKQLEDAQYYGRKEWNDWNIESIKGLAFYGLILLVLYFPVGIILLILDAVLVYYSFRPYWQINQTYVTGEMGKAEKIVSIIGEKGVVFGRFMINLVIKIISAILKLVYAIVTGSLFG